MIKPNQENQSNTGFFEIAIWSLLGLICLIAGFYAIHFEAPAAATKMESAIWTVISVMNLVGLILCGFKLDSIQSQF